MVGGGCVIDRNPYFIVEGFGNLNLCPIAEQYSGLAMLISRAKYSINVITDTELLYETTASLYRLPAKPEPL